MGSTSKREEHVFLFTAKEIADATKKQVDYHNARTTWWEKEYLRADGELQKTMKIIRKENQVTGGVHIDYSVDFGDQTEYRRMQEAYQKIQSHKQLAQRYEIDRSMYNTQGDRTYELTTSDVHYFHLAGEENES